ncbi:MAG: di-heme oxidoredictase family protein [Pseudomonadota bacterium]
MSQLITVIIVGFACLFLVSCQRAPEHLPAPGGIATMSALANRTFVLPSPTLGRAEQLRFWTGFALFRDPWVRAPASTTARDGLGPLFNARSCIACHSGAGRGSSIIASPQSPGTVFRVDPGSSADRWGSQLQPRATYDMRGDGVRTRGFFAAEPQPQIEVIVSSNGMRRIGATLEGHSDVALSVRIAPSLAGVGLLNAIPEASLISLSDPDDLDDDGISGRVHRLVDGEIGKFGWKAQHASVATQTAAAFVQDIGITSSIAPQESCSLQQTDCSLQPSGRGPSGNAEIPDELFAYIVDFVSGLPVPNARPVTPEIAAGQRLFKRLRCNECHTPSHAIQYQDQTDTIWPYTDLLLHDMGQQLEDGVVEGDAESREWRTPPLWGLGVARTINANTGLMHDGRARDIREAIMWHGGEAAVSASAFSKLPENQKDALAAFVLAL